MMRGAVAILVAAFFAAWAAYFLLRNTETPVSGRMDVAGLAAPATITRDREGVPHITGSSLEDVHFALGVAHAQDRLWQMELQRRAIAGRLSEIFGARTLSSDVFMRTLDLYGHASRSLAVLKPEQRAQIEAYAAGVNAYINRRTGLLEPRYPIEFMLLGHTPEPWTAADCAAIVKLMANYVEHSLVYLNKEMWRHAMAISTQQPESPFGQTYSTLDIALARQTCKLVEALQGDGAIHKGVDARALAELVFNNTNMMFIIFIKSEEMTVKDLMDRIRKQTLPVLRALTPAARA